jgi:hypothetical protein
MDAHLLATLLSYSVLPAAAISVLKMRQAGRTYLPFFICLFLALLNEIISTILILQHSGNGINANVYVFVEFLLLLWLFYNWNPSHRKKWLYTYLTLALGLIWFTETYLLNNLSHFSVIFRAVYSFVMVLLSGDQLSFILLNESNIFSNPRFILCVSFLIQYSYKAFFETFFVLNPRFSNEFYREFFLIWSIVNAAANLIYIPAVLWIPRKERYYITSC